MYGITNEDYLKSLGPENFLGNLILVKNRSLRELCSAGKSGSFFYFSYDSKFVLKTISSNEFDLFKSILEDYYKHMLDNPNTLMQRFFGLHTMIFNQNKMHFVIMNNVFNTGVKVHMKYDLKGSTFQRLSRRKKENDYHDYDFSIPLKDLDFIDRKEALCVMPEEKETIVKELCKDAAFLA
jgi:1-phosphatidylinositol-4-phosphate 5-kinase